MLALRSVTKRYGSLVALDDVSLDIARGEFFGLLGPNGAGKSTLMSLAAGLRAPEAGTLTLDGVAIKQGFALGGWVAFEPMGDTTMMMGDLVLTESEINQVMTKLLAEGLQVTAVQNHLLRASPPTVSSPVITPRPPPRARSSGS